MRFWLFIAITTILPLALLAQPKQNSPYSRFGIGDMSTRALPIQTGMGGTTVAFHDAFHLNLDNPASLAFLRTTSYETSLYSRFSQFSNGTDKQNVWSGNLGYMALGFTLKSPINEVLDKDKSPRKMAMAFSLAPVSQVGYLVETTDSTAEIGKIINDFEGKGGLYRFAWSNAIRYKNTSAGLSLGWNFGRISYENTTIFNGINTVNDANQHFQNNFRNEYSIKGLSWKLGVQHDFILETAENDKDIPTRWITVGLTGESNHRLTTISDELRIRSRGKRGDGSYLTPDTISISSGVKQHLTLPATLGVGFQYVKADKFKIGGEVGLEQWSNYKNEVRPEQFSNTISAAVGVEFIPDAASYKVYSKRIRYRAGAYYRQDPRVVGDNDLNDYGVTMGVGLPLLLPRQQTSFINFALELGKIGANTPISEAYGRLTVGFTLNDNTWFFKRRFE